MSCLFIACGGIENDGRIVHAKKYERALIFSSNRGCVTSSREKIAPNCINCLGGGDCARRDCLARRELVCAIPRDTSKDSARIESAAWRLFEDSPDERDTLGRTRTKRHYHCAKLRRNPRSFS